MKSKYAPLVRLKKEKLEEAQRALLQSNLKIQKLQDKIVKIKSELYEFEKPNSGSLKEYQQYALFTSAYRKELDREKNQLAIAFHHHNFAQDRLNKSMIEYEKFQYLKTEEEKAQMQKIKKEEALYLDEVAVIGYNMQKAEK